MRTSWATEFAPVMRNNNVGYLIVTDARSGSGTPIGVLTDRDIVVKVLAKDVADTLRRLPHEPLSPGIGHAGDGYLDLAMQHVRLGVPAPSTVLPAPISFCASFYASTSGAP